MLLIFPIIDDAALQGLIPPVTGSTSRTLYVAPRRGVRSQAQPLGPRCGTATWENILGTKTDQSMIIPEWASCLGRGKMGG